MLVRITKNERSDKDNKFLPVSVRDVDKDSELTATSLLDMTSINSGSGTQHDV